MQLTTLKFLNSYFQVSSEDLQRQVSSLTDMISMPWFLNKDFSEFKRDCEKLIDGMNRYLNFLKNQMKKTADAHASKEPLRSLTDNWSMKFIPKVKEVEIDYRKLDTDLVDYEHYEPVFLYDYEPSDRIERRYWLEHLSLSVGVKIYKHRHGNYFGNFTFVWKCDEQEHCDGDLKAIDAIRLDLRHFSTRAMRNEFITKYSQSCKIKPAILRNVYHFLTQDSSSAEHQQQAEVDARVAEFLVTSDDPELFYDLRKNNGRPKDEKLKPFWSELQKYLDEVAVVDDRRETPYMFMPLAMSLTNLISIIKARLPGESPCPSVSWLRLNFWPCNAYTRAAMCYTGVFKVKYAVQQRLLRQKHQDSAYAFQLFAMFKEMAVKYGEVSEFISLDDKSIVPIGEPNKPVSTGVRPHNRALVPEGVKLYALDHDFHIHGAVPSVLFRIDIPSNSRDSFYNGNVHVTVKDKVFNPSSALRHATETVKILRSEGSADGVNLSNPLLFVYTDGGPDHRTNFISVQLSYLVIFFALDLDMLIAARTAPSQSYANPAERCMSLLNMALQHVSLQRREMDANSEVRVKSLSSLKKLRSAADKQPALREKLMESLEPVLAQLKQRFSQLKLHDDPVLVHDAASDEEMKNMSDILDILKEVDGGNNAFSQLKTKSDVVKFDKLKDFVERHWRSRPYSFQVCIFIGTLKNTNYQGMMLLFLFFI